MPVWSQNSNRDTIRKLPDCTRFHEEEQIYLKKLTSEAEKINYSGLGKKIVQNMIPDYISSEDLIVFLENRIDIICAYDYMWDCISKDNTTNPNYNDADFWTPKTLRFISRFLNKNIIPKKTHMGLSYETFFINQKVGYGRKSRKEIKNPAYFKTYQDILTWEKGKYLNEEYHVLRYKARTAINPATANSVAVSFRNFTDRKVEVFITYNQHKLISTGQILTFQYNHKKWELVYSGLRDQ